MSPYALRRTWPGRPDRKDYVIHCEGLAVGRVYLSKLPDGEQYVWTIYINGHVPLVRDVPISGSAVTLGLAGTDFKRSYERMRDAAKLPKPRAKP
jgi:hypothetical protein